MFPGRMKVASRLGFVGRRARGVRRFTASLAAILARSEPADVACPCCGSRPRAATATRDAVCFISSLTLRRRVCGECGLVFGPWPLVACRPEELAGLYRHLYTFFSEGSSTTYQERTFHLMNPSRRGAYLNYACGDWSEGIGHLRHHGWNVIGYEPFQPVTAAGIVRDAAALEPEAFDGVMSHNFIEHVQDPIAFFGRCRSLLKPGGIMAHSSPCYEYLAESSPLHLFFYCGDAPAKLAERAGFSQIADHRVDLDMPGHRYACVLFRRAT